MQPQITVMQLEYFAGQRTHCLVICLVFVVLHCNYHADTRLSSLLSSRPSSWSSDGQYCRVVKESGNYVECACSHLSIYTAYAEFATLASYNEAFYASGFICISGTERSTLTSLHLHLPPLVFF